ncbi:bifunctional UDP-sugar hydrolase/5'-nucleotidase [Dongia sp.]|uniref:bifunctional metallophosphatase/5'-nucleotidase n=1 Tax=Dongia sp. TaxID=1977262 RepID=UPI0035B12472
MRRRFWVIATALLALGCSADRATGPVSLRLLAFNDFHGNIQSADPSPGRIPIVKDGKTELVDAGGAAYLAPLIAQERAGHPNTLLVSAGDLTGASPMLSGLLKDEPTIRVMNGIGLDLNVVGNHEFDSGSEELVRKSGLAQFAYLAANVVDTASGQPLFPPYVVKKVGGIDVAFIGVVTKETPHIVAARGVTGLRFLDETETLNRYAADLSRQGIHAIVAVIHEGATPGADTPTDGSNCKDLAGALVDIVQRSDPAIDLFISGHTHQNYACKLDGRMVTQAANYGRMLSVIDLTLDPASRDVLGVAASNLPVTRDLTPDAKVLAELSQADAATAPMRAKKVATLPIALLRKPADSGESALGDVIADAQLAAARELGAELAITNPGGIRQDLPSDPAKGLSVSLGDLFAVQPFGNNLVAMDVTGAELKLLLEQQWLGQPEDRKPRILQISSGFTYCYDSSRPEGDRILAASMQLNGKPIVPATSYRIAVNNFLAGGGDRFVVLKDGRHQVQGGSDLDALRDYLVEAAPGLKGDVAGRICRKG